MRWDVWLGEALRQEPLDLGLALVRGGREELVRVLGRQVRRQQDDRAQVQVAIGQGGEDGGVLARGACPANPVEGRLLGQTQFLDAIWTQ